MFSTASGSFLVTPCTRAFRDLCAVVLYLGTFQLLLSNKGNKAPNNKRNNDAVGYFTQTELLWLCFVFVFGPNVNPILDFSSTIQIVQLFSVVNGVNSAQWLLILGWDFPWPHYIICHSVRTTNSDSNYCKLQRQKAVIASSEPRCCFFCLHKWTLKRPHEATKDRTVADLSFWGNARKQCKISALWREDEEGGSLKNHNVC